MRAVRMGWIALALVGCSKPADKPAETADAEVTAMAETAPAAAVSPFRTATRFPSATSRSMGTA